jgi:hypothetical protein
MVIKQAHSKLRGSAWQFMPASVTVPILAVHLAASTSGLKQPTIVSYEACNIPSYTIHNVITYNIPESIPCLE